MRTLDNISIVVIAFKKLQDYLDAVRVGKNEERPGKEVAFYPEAQHK